MPSSTMSAVVTDSSFKAIPWPFTVCGDGDWTIESVTLSQTPKRNINDEIVTVNFPFILDWNS